MENRRGGGSDNSLEFSMGDEEKRIIDMLNKECESNRGNLQREFHNFLLEDIPPSIYDDDEQWCICGRILVLNESDHRKGPCYCSSLCELNQTSTKKMDNMDHTSTLERDDGVPREFIVLLSAAKHYVSRDSPITNRVTPFPNGIVKQCCTCSLLFDLNETPHFEKDRFGSYWCSKVCAFVSVKICRDAISSSSSSIVRPNTNEGA